MTPGDAAKLLALAAAFDRRTVGEADAMAWASTLDDLRLEDCIDAVKNHYRESTEWIMPSHVRAGVRAIHRERIAYVRQHDPHAVPDADPDDVPAYLAAIREGRYRPASVEAVPRPEVLELVESAAKGLPKDVA